MHIIREESTANSFPTNSANILRNERKMKLNKWDKEHQSNMAAYEREIDKIFQTAAREAAVLAAASGDFKADKPFSFDDYPATRKKIEKLLSGLKSSIYAVVVNGINTEWGLSNEKNDELVYSSIGKQWTGKRGGQHTVRNSKRYFNNNDDAREAFIERKISGLNLSDRVWKYTEQFKSEIEMGIEFGLRDGLSADEMSRDLRQYLRYPDKLFRRVRNEYGTLVLSKQCGAWDIRWIEENGQIAYLLFNTGIGGLPVRKPNI